MEAQEGEIVSTDKPGYSPAMKARNLYLRVTKLVRLQGMLFLDLGEAFKTIRDEELYKHMGEGGFDSFDQFLNNPEIKFKPSTAYLYISVFEYYHLKLELPKEEIAKNSLHGLMKVMAKLKQKPVEEAREIVTTLESLTTYDFHTESKERGIIEDKPQFFRDQATGKWVLKFRPGMMLSIINMETNEDLLQYNKDNSKDKPENKAV